MVKYVRDTLYGFSERPHYEAIELDTLFESAVRRFLKEKYGKVEFPFKTEDIATLIERDVSDLDLYSDLSRYGESVEGVTEFKRGAKPNVLISNLVHQYENRLRTTLAHEYGHVVLHNYLFTLARRPVKVAKNQSLSGIYCNSDTIVSASRTDWMEWQACYASGALLMPRSSVHSLINAVSKRHGLLGATDDDSAVGRAMVFEVMNVFMVSRDAAVVRLKILNLLTNSPRQKSLFTS